MKEDEKKRERYKVVEQNVCKGNYAFIQIFIECLLCVSEQERQRRQIELSKK